jgi:hypothetical protein
MARIRLQADAQVVCERNWFFVGNERSANGTHTGWGLMSEMGVLCHLADPCPAGNNQHRENTDCIEQKRRDNATRDRDCSLAQLQVTLPI